MDNGKEFVTKEELELRLSTVADLVMVLNKFYDLSQKIQSLEQRMICLETDQHDVPEYIQSIKNEADWLRRRFDDINRIFNWENMILKGVKNE